MERKEKGKDGDLYAQTSLEKGAVLQEVRIFSANPLKPKACYSLLSRILWVIMHGESINKKEATDVFFGVTKLFQSKDVPLRRMVYVVLKELAKISDDVLIAIAILSKDMVSELEPFRANSIRVISRVVDTTMLGQVERNIKQSIVDREPYVASCALVSGIHLVHRSPDIVKRWVSEVQEAINSRSLMVQYHALALLHQIRQQDPMAISKLVYSLAKGSVRSHLAHCLLIRFSCKIMADQPGQNRDPVLFAYVESCLRYSSDLVVFEAARQLAALPNASFKELETSIAVLQPFLTSPKATLRYAAVKVIHKVAMQAPRAIDANCCFELRNLISDSNRNISTIAVVTLLQVEKESGVGVLLKEIGEFVGEISDDFKVSVVDGIRTLASKYPSQHAAIMATLSTMLRAEAGFDYKRRIVDTFLEIIRDIPESKDYALAYLCEYIEDCEFTYLSTKILHLLGQEGPHSSSYAVFIRYIYNRVILEKAAVRASALTALSRYSTIQPHVVKILLEQCAHDSDDHVRDKATFFLNILEKLPEDDTSFIKPQLHVPLDNLDAALVEYLAAPGGGETPFDISTVSLERIVPLAKPTQVERPMLTGTKSSGAPALDLSNVLTSTTESAASTASRVGTATPPVKMMELFPDLGPLFKTSAAMPLTEADIEYQVTCFRHVFPHTLSIVLQFNIVNTLSEQAIRDITVDIVPTDSVRAPRKNAAKAKIARLLPHKPLLFAHGAPESTLATTYIVLNYKEELKTHPFPVLPLAFKCTLKFESVPVIDEATGEIDDGGGVQDEYAIDNLEILSSDNVKKVSIADWKTAFDKMEPIQNEDGTQTCFQSLSTFALTSTQNISDAVHEIIGILGMQPCNGTDDVAPKKTKHVLELVGLHVSGARLIGRARLMKTNNPGVAVELCIRSNSEIISQALVNAVISQ